MSQRWRLDDAAHHSTLTLRKVRAVLELRREEGAGRSTLTLRKVRAVFELRHVEVELSFEQRPRGCGPSSNHDTQSKPQEGAGLAHQSRRRALGFGKSPRNLMPGSETVWGNGLGQRFGATVRHNLSARPSADLHVVATRGGCRPQPESDQRRKTGSQAVFRTVMVPDTGLDTTA